MPGSLNLRDVRFEHHPTGLGVPVATPRISWRFSTCADGPKDWFQTSYIIEVKRLTKDGPTTRVFTPQDGTSSHLNAWPDKPLVSRERAQVRVRSHGQMAGYSEPVSSEWSAWTDVEAALLDESDWKAKFIGSGSQKRQGTAIKGESSIRPIRLRKAFRADGDVEGSRLYITSLGIYAASINGQRVGDEQLSPGWTSYHDRLQYQVYDVSALLQPRATNTLAIEVAPGWYAGRLLWGEGVSCLYGDRIGALAQLEIAPSTLSSVKPISTIITDETWECCESPIVSSSMYDGEHYDMRLEESGWATPSASDSTGSWSAAAVLPTPQCRLVASSSPPVKVMETVRPVKIFKSASGTNLVDFGQNLVGRLQIGSLKRPEGHKIQIRHAEVLENGELGSRPLRAAKATDSIIFGASSELKGWSPTFTFHGFRYVEIDGWDPEDPVEPLTEDSISALVMHTAMDRTGFFECSDELVNKFHENVVWSMKGNFVSIPTDCPQRDERLGWTGDIQAFCPTASFLYDCAGMLGNWMEDVLIDQKASDGVVPLVVPNALVHQPWPVKAQAVWDDVVVLLPWTLYNAFGDEEILQRSYSGMRDHLDKAIPRGEDGLWDPDLWQLGDWLDPNAPPSEPGLARTDGTLVADEYLVHITGVMAKIAAVLRLGQDAQRYASDFDRLRRVFEDKYMARSGLIVGDSQTSLALALIFRLHLLPEQRRVASERLARLVRYAKFKVSTGFAGTPAVLHALSSSSKTEDLQLAYRMLLEDKCPSWLYQVRMGATTMWERWDSMLPDGSINPGEMTSFNHYALGSVANWVHVTIGGLSATAPGWKEFLVKPRPGGDVTSAKTGYLSTCGKIECSWEIREGSFRLEVIVPPNSTARVVLPGQEYHEGSLVGSGRHQFESAYKAPGPWPPKPLLTENMDEKEAVRRGLL